MTLTMDYLLAVLVGVAAGIPLGVMLALPWRSLIKRKVQTTNIDDLRRQLDEAIAELQRPQARFDTQTWEDRGYPRDAMA